MRYKVFLSLHLSPAWSPGLTMRNYKGSEWQAYLFNILTRRLVSQCLPKRRGGYEICRHGLSARVRWSYKSHVTVTCMTCTRVTTGRRCSLFSKCDGRGNKTAARWKFQHDIQREEKMSSHARGDCSREGKKEDSSSYILTVCSFTTLNTARKDPTPHTHVHWHWQPHRGL